MINVIAIDGPAGSGKSTIAKSVAKNMGYLYIDTGAMYRALTLKAVKNSIDLNSGKELVALSGKTDIKLVTSKDGLKVLLDGEDVSSAIRELAVSEKVKYIAKVRGVREHMVRMQRELGRSADGAVLEGRDIGTVVFPDARHKFFMDASFDERVARRFKELKDRSVDCTREEVAKDLKERDESDINRKVGPLKKAEDAERIDTTDMTIDEVVTEILGRVRGK